MGAKLYLFPSILLARNPNELSKVMAIIHASHFHSSWVNKGRLLPTTGEDGGAVTLIPGDLAVHFNLTIHFHMCFRGGFKQIHGWYHLPLASSAFLNGEIGRTCAHHATHCPIFRESRFR